MSETPARVIPAAAPDELLQQASVEVTVSFPPIKMTLLEAQSLKRGSIVELGQRLAQVPLTVHVTGQPLATGYLVVLVEDKAAVLLSATEGAP